GFVGQAQVGQVLHGKLHGGVQGFFGDGDVMVLFVQVAHTGQDCECFFGGWLFDQDGTQATFHGCVLFNGSIFLWGCGADAAESATGQGRLENACSVNAAISSTACTDEEMHFVDEEDDIAATFCL